MWHVADELHSVSLRFIRLLMQFILLLPARPSRYHKLINTGVLIVYLIYILHWRFGYNYLAFYDIVHDNVSRLIDFTKFSMLIIGHCVVAVELLWRNRSSQIEHELESMRFTLLKEFGQKMSLLPIRRYSNAICGLFSLCVLLLLVMGACCNLSVTYVRLLNFSLYSEMVLFMRLAEFSVFATLILVFYLEFRSAALNLIQELEKSRFEVWTTRRAILNRLYTLQQLHGQLWNTVRLIESNFELSLVIIMLKYFLDNSVLPYWIFVSEDNNTHFIITYYIATEELCKFVALVVPCLICTRCDVLQRRFRSVFHSLSADRYNQQLNHALFRISAQLGQEEFYFSAGGLLNINNDTLGKFIFGMASYIVICIQFRVSLIVKSTENVFVDVEGNNKTITVD